MRKMSVRLLLVVVVCIAVVALSENIPIAIAIHQNSAPILFYLGVFALCMIIAAGILAIIRPKDTRPMGLVILSRV